MSRRLPSQHQTAPDQLHVRAHREPPALVQRPASRASTRPCSVVELLRARDLALDVHGVADLHRLLEDGVAHPAQRHDALGVERQQADGEGEHQQAVGDLLAEAARRGPVGVDVLRMARRRSASRSSRMSGPRSTVRRGVAKRSPDRERVEVELEEVAGGRAAARAGRTLR